MLPVVVGTFRVIAASGTASGNLYSYETTTIHNKFDTALSLTRREQMQFQVVILCMDSERAPGLQQQHSL